MALIQEVDPVAAEQYLKSIKKAEDDNVNKETPVARPHSTYDDDVHAGREKPDSPNGGNQRLDLFEYDRLFQRTIQVSTYTNSLQWDDCFKDHFEVRPTFLYDRQKESVEQ